ncbi:hypothetical protein JYJ95_13000 [Corallococcus exiguus]|uniref:hypothetical protein n=1 Tax=Corallococcus exiguus TaxID=83462 RepID=UPI001A8C7820|nr:hypothetical protein [Corallococcus exiguus]MBN8467434.1 hypothetical protein [Corallococcus exiguus]
MNQTVATVVESALTFATFASFALPPPAGFVVGGVLASINLIISKCAGGDPSSGANFLANLNTAFLKDLEHGEIDMAVAAFASYATWLQEYDLNVQVPPGLKEGSDALAYSEFMNFYKNLEEAVTNPGAPLRNQLQVLLRTDSVTQGSSFETRGLYAFLYGASVFAALSKIYISINSTAFQKTDTSSVTVFLAELKRFIDHANSTLDYIDQQRVARMNAITAAQNKVVIENGLGTAGTTHVFSFQDNDTFYPRPNKSSDIGNSLFSSSYSDLPANTVYAHHASSPNAERDANAFHDTYVAQAQQMFDDYFLSTNRQDIEDTLAQLKQALTNFQAIAS